MEVPLRPGEEVFTEVEDDPWGHPFELEQEGASIRIRSWGPDGERGTKDDICHPPVNSGEEEKR
jgi:hypothetical protein